MKKLFSILLIALSVTGWGQANTSPVFAKSPCVWGVRISSTTTSRGGGGVTPSNLSTIFTARQYGTKITQWQVIADTTTTAATAMLFVTDSTGAILYPVDNMLVTAITPSNTVLPFKQINSYSDLELRAGQILKGAINALTAGTEIFFLVQIGDY